MDVPQAREPGDDGHETPPSKPKFLNLAYPRKNLNSNEQIKLDLHPHWFMFVKPSTISAVLFVVLMNVQFRLDDGWFKTGASRVLLVALLVSLILLGNVMVRWSRTYFVVTSQRVIFREGVLARRGVEIPLERVNNVNFAQSFFERMVGAGDLLIESASSDGQQLFSDIRDPEQVQNIIHDAINQRTHKSATGEPLAQLERLEAMFLRGSITQSEFETQKRRLLG